MKSDSGVAFRTECKGTSDYARRGCFVIGKNRIDEKTREWAEKKKKEKKNLAAPFREQRQHERISLTSRLFVPWQPFVCRRVRH